MTGEERLGQKLRELREGHGWTLRRAAQAVGISHQRLAELERGIARGTHSPTRPSRRVVVQLATAYRAPENTLLELAGYAVERASLSSDASWLLDLYARLEAKDRAIVLRVVETLANALAKRDGH